MEENKTYNLEYWIGSKFVETVESNKTWPVIMNTKKKLQKTTHKAGKFITKAL